MRVIHQLAIMLVVSVACDVAGGADDDGERCYEEVELPVYGVDAKTLPLTGAAGTPVELADGALAVPTVEKAGFRVSFARAGAVTDGSVVLPSVSGRLALRSNGELVVTGKNRVYVLDPAGALKETIFCQGNQLCATLNSPAFLLKDGTALVGIGPSAAANPPRKAQIYLNGAPAFETVGTLRYAPLELDGNRIAFGTDGDSGASLYVARRDKFIARTWVPVGITAPPVRLKDGTLAFALRDGTVYLLKDDGTFIGRFHPPYPGGVSLIALSDGSLAVGGARGIGFLTSDGREIGKLAESLVELKELKDGTLVGVQGNGICFLTKDRAVAGCVALGGMAASDVKLEALADGTLAAMVSGSRGHELFFFSPQGKLKARFSVPVVPDSQGSGVGTVFWTPLKGGGVAVAAQNGRLQTLSLSAKPIRIEKSRREISCPPNPFDAPAVGSPPAVPASARATDRQGKTPAVDATAGSALPDSTSAPAGP